MKKDNTFKRVSGGGATRAEVYGLFFAAIVIIGGGVGGAIALSNTSDLSPDTISPSQSASSAEVVQPVQGNGVLDSTPTQYDVPTQNSNTNPCPYTPEELTYYNNIRSTKQVVVDQAQTEVNGFHLAIASNTAHLEELLAAPYRPIEVFQRHPDGTPAAWRVDSNDEIAFERQRIVDNQTALVRAEETLQRAIADRDQVPGC